MNKLRALCEKWKREVYDYNPVACAAELEAILPDVERLAEALRKLPLEAFGDDMSKHDAADFVAHAGEFFEAMVAIRAALALFDQPVAPKETK